MKKVYQKFGVYRSFMSRYKMAKNVDLVPGQVVYFDEVRTKQVIRPKNPIIEPIKGYNIKTSIVGFSVNVIDAD